jgi:hypothetical protein
MPAVQPHFLDFLKKILYIVEKAVDLCCKCFLR